MSPTKPDIYAPDMIDKAVTDKEPEFRKELDICIRNGSTAWMVLVMSGEHMNIWVPRFVGKGHKHIKQLEDELGVRIVLTLDKSLEKQRHYSKMYESAHAKIRIDKGTTEQCVRAANVVRSTILRIVRKRV